LSPKLGLQYASCCERCKECDCPTLEARWPARHGGNCIWSLESWVACRHYRRLSALSVLSTSQALFSCSRAHCIVRLWCCGADQFHCTPSGGGRVCLL